MDSIKHNNNSHHSIHDNTLALFAAVPALCGLQYLLWYSWLWQAVQVRLTSTAQAQAMAMQEEQLQAVWATLTQGRDCIPLDELIELSQQAAWGSPGLLQMLQSMDSNGDNTIDYNEFVAALTHVNEEEREQQPNEPSLQFSAEQLSQLRRIFDFVDADGSGEIDSDELSAALRQMGKNYSHEDVEKMMRTVCLAVPKLSCSL